MAYSKLQCVAYEIYTGPVQTKPRHYCGVNDDEQDAELRAQLMSEAIEAAASSTSTDASTDTLKVFMAPEFYFRGMRGGYSPEIVVGNAVKGGGLDPSCLLARLTQTVKAPKYADWLFVFGTAIMRSVPNPLSLWERFYNWVTSRPSNEVYNVAVVQKGGCATEEERLSSCVVCMKEFKSTIDFLTLPPTGIDGSTAAHLASGPVSYAGELNQPLGPSGGGFNGGGIFTLDGITFGLEVCLDHAKRRLRRARPGRACFVPQVQLIPSGGMTITPTSVATVSSGIVFNVDGLSPATPEAPNATRYGYHSDLRVATQVYPSSLTAIVSTAAPARIPVHGANKALSRVFWVPPNGQSDPQVAVYPSQAIPPSVIIA